MRAAPLARGRPYPPTESLSIGAVINRELATGDTSAVEASSLPLSADAQHRRAGVFGSSESRAGVSIQVLRGVAGVLGFFAVPANRLFARAIALTN